MARYTRLYRNERGAWISAFAPVTGEPGKRMSVLVVDYPLEIYLDRLRELRMAIVQASLAGALVASVVGLLVARRITRPVSALTRVLPKPPSSQDRSETTWSKWMLR